MTNASTDFLEKLGRREHEPLLENTTGTIRLELRNGKRTERWLVSIDEGDVSVSHRSAAATCTVRTTKELFDGVAAGEVNAFAAVLRGEIDVEGDTKLLIRFQRLFPSPPRASAKGRRTAKKEARR